MVVCFVQTQIVVTIVYFSTIRFEFVKFLGIKSRGYTCHRHVFLIHMPTIIRPIARPKLNSNSSSLLHLDRLHACNKIDFFDLWLRVPVNS